MISEEQRIEAMYRAFPEEWTRWGYPLPDSVLQSDEVLSLSGNVLVPTRDGTPPRWVRWKVVEASQASGHPDRKRFKVQIELPPGTPPDTLKRLDLPKAMSLLFGAHRTWQV